MNDRAPDDDEVICPNCVHQFPAIPINVQKHLTSAHALCSDLGIPPGEIGERIGKARLEIEELKERSESDQTDEVLAWLKARGLYTPNDHLHGDGPDICAQLTFHENELCRGQIPKAGGGWKLVPVEPTEDMLSPPVIGRPLNRWLIDREIYAAVIAAAPEYKP